jgi:hypothetical protein
LPLSHFEHFILWEKNDVSQTILHNCVSIGLVAVAWIVAAAAYGAPPLQWDDENGRFKPMIEAELPEGFPGYTPVGTIEVKEYPKYRKAETSGKVAFWSLYSHIKDNQIAMTAPVEMTLAADKANQLQEQSMAFLYGKANQGNLGKKGSVTVVDVPQMTVVSIGVRGPRGDAVVADAQDRLSKWLAQNKEQYVETGPPRLMGYNSPFVPKNKQFFELQIPIRDVKLKAPETPATDR